MAQAAAAAVSWIAETWAVSEVAAYALVAAVEIASITEYGKPMRWRVATDGIIGDGQASRDASVIEPS